MPTYEYECNRCHVRFERRQSMKDEPLKECPECGGDVQRMVSGGSG
ncbi:MAG TPA: zinc ribbon domain-containing protein, partial [Syntrophaceae bacterium]|nr:zinc ribbon domain-containing protein [Syntrophaceae bacterium]